MEKVKCSICKREVDKLDIFSKGECLKCHEEIWDNMSEKEKAETPMFDNKKILNIQ